MRITVLTVVAAILLTASANSQPSKEQIETSTKKVKELQKERIATLKEMVDQCVKLANNARVEFAEVLEARMMLLKAELDAAEKESDRITICKNALAALKEYEMLAINLVQSGRGPRLTVLKIKARRLELEIALEQAKVKEANSGK